MTGLRSIVCAILLLALYPVDVQAQSQIFFPSGDVSYWSPGSLVQLPWTYNYTKSNISTLQWLFTKSSTEMRLAVFAVEFGATKPKIDYQMYNITGQATLEFKNANISHNGTYSFKITLRNSKIKESKIDVIILEQPTAVIKCSPSSLTVKEGEDITCLCSATGGNPPATASWSKNGTMVNGTGYLKKNLILKNISKKDTGTYNCTVRSHNLTDTKSVNITLKPKHKPRNISFSSNEPNTIVTSGDRVEITCKADAYPEASYSILLNDSQLLTNAVSGSYNISSVNDSHAGNYTCVAKNIIGNVSAQLVLTVNVRPTPTPTLITVSTRTVNPSVSMSTAPPDTRETGTPKGDNIAIIAGAAAGGAVFLEICILLIWYFYCKHSGGGSRMRCCKGEEDTVPNPSNDSIDRGNAYEPVDAAQIEEARAAGEAENHLNPSYAAMGDSMDRGNAYESVDAAKIEQARAADEAGPSNESPPDAGNGLPPVYAVVDKSKKTPKSPPEKSPPDAGNGLPPVYAVVETPKPPPEKKSDSVTYASLDPVSLQPDSSKMQDRTQEDTNNASIELEQLNKDQE